MVSGNEDERLDEVYYEVAVDTPKGRKIFIPRSRLTMYIQNGRVAYRSTYGFKNTVLDHRKIFETTSSFKDTCYIESLVFDVDTHSDKSDLDAKGKPKEVFDDKEALMRVLEEGVFRIKELIKQLAEMTGTSEYSIPIWYSGRGFHLQTPNFFNFKPSNYLREEVDATMRFYFPFIDYKPYMTTGLIRLNYSYNDKSKTYKIPVHYSELRDIESILKKAQSPYDAEGKYHKVSLDDWDAYDLSDKIITPTAKAAYEVNKFDTTRIVTCVQKMFKEGSIKGSRHDNLLRMLTVWRKNGMTYEQSFLLAKSWLNGEWTDYEINNQVDSVWRRKYKPYSCTDEVMARYCDFKCIFYKAKNFNITITDNLTIEQELKEFLIDTSNPDGATFDLQTMFDLPVECQIRKSNGILLLGYPKIGKTFLMQFIIQKSKKRTLYYTLEMPSMEVYQRQIQIALEESEKEVTERLVSTDENFHDHVKHITFIDQSPTLLDIQSHIEELEPDWVVIDTIDQMTEEQFKGNETMKLTYLFQQLKQMAIRNKVVIFVIQHIVKETDKEGKLKPLTMFSGLYSKEGARKFDKILGWEGYIEDTRRKLKTLGLRRGKHFEKFMEYSESLSSLIPEKSNLISKKLKEGED